MGQCNSWRASSNMAAQKFDEGHLTMFASEEPSYQKKMPWDSNSWFWRFKWTCFCIYAWHCFTTIWKINGTKYRRTACPRWPWHKKRSHSSRHWSRFYLDTWPSLNEQTTFWISDSISQGLSRFQAWCRSSILFGLLLLCK